MCWSCLLILVTYKPGVSGPAFTFAGLLEPWYRTYGGVEAVLFDRLLRFPLRTAPRSRSSDTDTQ